MEQLTVVPTASTGQPKFARAFEPDAPSTSKQQYQTKSR